MTEGQMPEFDQETRDFHDSSKAAIDRGDVLEWVLVMAEDERKILAKYGFGNPHPFEMVATEIRRMRDEIVRLTKALGK